MQLTWRDEERRIEQGAEDGALIACARGPPVMIKHMSDWRCYNGPDETARIASGPPDRDPTNVIQAFF